MLSIYMADNVISYKQNKKKHSKNKNRWFRYINGFNKRFNILTTANWQFAMLSHLYNGVCPAEYHIHICLDFEISYFRNGLGDVFGTIPSSLVQFNGKSTWTDRNRILFKPNSRKTQCLPRWRFGRNSGECLQEIPFGKVAICRRHWQNHRSRAFPNFKTWGIS